MIEWDQSFMTGVPAVDNDHQELVRQINFLEAALINGTG